MSSFLFFFLCLDKITKTVKTLFNALFERLLIFGSISKFNIKDLKISYNIVQYLEIALLITIIAM